MKRCCRCGKTKDVSEFYKDKKRNDGVQTYCIPCTKELHKDRSWYYKTGRSRPLSEATDCSGFLGVHIAERVLSHYFEDITRMPYGNVGYDFICKKGYKIDAKSSCLGETKDKVRSPRWTFAINKNTIADYFILLAFDNRDNLEPQHVWLVPGEKINNRVLIGIANTPKVIEKWKIYEKPLDKVVECCNVLKHV